MRKVCICGHLADGTNMNDGQTVKTRVLRDGLIQALGAVEVYCIDTHGRLNQILLFPRLIIGLSSCRNIIILPAKNGLPLISRWLCICNTVFHRKLHYSVIGGWLAEYLDTHPNICKSLYLFHTIFVETSTMRRALEARGFKNIMVIPNCKQLPVVHASKFPSTYCPPYHLVTFSRVMRQKGIEDIIRIVSVINKENGGDMYHLDIYGPIDPKELQWWNEQMNIIDRNDAIHYKGNAPANESVNILSQYFALVFPTRFYTEGIPGTIIDAYAAGVPVISSKWESFDDIIEDNVTGMGFGFENWDELKEILLMIYNNPCMFLNMKNNCIEKAKSYLPSNVIPAIVSALS